jgi:predicted TIM-barrel fold metal-dependent hydrolase
MTIPQAGSTSGNAQPGAAAAPGPVAISGSYADYRTDWLALHDEAVLEPDRVIIDAHHHVWDLPRPRYMFDELNADVASGHNVIATVYVDCRSMYRCDGPVEMRSLGEVEFANGVAAQSASGSYGRARLCAGIVGNAALPIGARAQHVLEALMRAGGDRFKGVRQVSAWDADSAVSKPIPGRPQGLLGDKAFREGFACLGPLGLSFDAFLFQPQIPELTNLARAFPETSIVLDHAGTPLGVGTYAGRSDELFAAWKSSMAELARCANVCVKLGGLGMVVAGFDFHQRNRPPDSMQLAEAWRPYIETCIELFGASRCMFESNFPPDKGTCSYVVLWNAFKRIVAGASESEKADLFSRSAARFYRLDLAALQG